MLLGKYKHGKPNEEIILEDVQTALAKSKLSPMKKAYVILLYWLGCRRTEPLVLGKEDIEEHNGSLFISINYRKNSEGKPILYSRGKKGQCGGPVELKLSLWGLEIVKKVWKKTRKHRKVFPFHSNTAYNTIKILWPKKSPHWLRYQRVTKLRRKRDENKLSIDEIKSFTGIRRDSTIEGYGLKTKADIHKVAKLLD